MKDFFLLWLLLIPCFGIGQVADMIDKDTIKARTLLNEAILLNDSGMYQSAYDKALTSSKIWSFAKGEQCLEVSESKCEIGGALNKLSRAQEALPELESALQIRDEVLKKSDLTTARICSNLGSCYFYLNKYDESISFIQKSILIRHSILGANHPLIASNYHSLGSIFINTGEYDKAVDNLTKALNIRISTIGKNNKESADTYNNLGTSFYYKGEFKKAIECYQKSLDISEKIFGKSNNSYARGLMNIGIVFFQNSDYELSIKYTNLCLDVLKEVSQPDESFIAGCYNNLGNNYKLLGRYNLAIEQYTKGLNIYLKIYGEDHPRTADAYSNIGDVYRNMGYSLKSINYFYKSLAIRFKTQGANHPDVAGVYQNLGLSYTSLQNFEKAIEMNKKALDIRIKVLGPDHPYIALIYSSLGGVYYYKKEYNESINYLLKSIELYDNGRSENLNTLIYVLELTGALYNNIKNFDKAIFYYNKELEKIKIAFGENSFHEAKNNFLLAQAYWGKNDIIKADSLFKRSEQIWPKVENPEIMTYLIFLGNVIKFEREKYRSSGNKEYLKNAAIYLDKSLEIMGSLLHNDRTRISKGYSNDTPIDFQEPALEALTEIIEDQNNYLTKNQAFFLSEISRSNQLYEISRESEARQYADIPDSLLTRELELRLELTHFEKAKQQLVYENGYSESDSTVIAINSKIFDLSQKNESLLNYFETNYPDYYRLKYQLDAVSLQYVQDTLLHPKQTLLEYFIGDSNVFIFVIRSDTFHLAQIKKDFPLEEWVSQFRQSITANLEMRQPVSSSNIVKYTGIACALYNKLIAPVRNFLTPELTIVSDGVLGYLPFEALLVERPVRPDRFHECHYLLQDYIISYAYSATFQREMLNKEHYTKATRPLAAFAPYYSGDTTLLANLYTRDNTMRNDLRPLKHSGEESYSISKIMEGDLFISKDATEDRFISVAGKYQILHLATHGQVNDHLSDYSFLAFTEQKDSVENELLYIRDLYNLHLNADLVVLSACETGIGELQRGEGVISLARAFAYAGAKSIITTMWSVDDAKTKDLMIAFYSNLKTGMPKNVALTKAKRDFLKKHLGTNAHPFYWAAFIGIGDMRSLTK